MTMLDRMRRHKAWLKWSLGLVVVTFVLLYVPSFIKPGGVGAAPGDVIATVEGRSVTAGGYRRLYAQQLQQLQQSYGGQINEQMLQQLGISQRIVQQMVDEAAMLAEADRLDLDVSDAELDERIQRLPGFQENGKFIGPTRYRQVLQMQRPPLRPSEFEEEMRKQLVAEKLQAAVTGWVRVSDAEVEAEYRKRNEKIKLQLAIFSASLFREGITPTEAELTTYFTANQETYRIPEKRRVKFLSVDADALRAKMTATQAEIEAKYRENLANYSTPEQVRSSHILLKTEGKDEAAVKTAAEAVLAKAKAGTDFAALAKQHSEDDQNKDKGGDLGFYGRGTMQKEFEDGAWDLKPGEISGLVKTTFGFHVIRGGEKKAAQTRALAEVRAQVEDQIKTEKAQAEATRIAEDAAKGIDDPSDLDRTARERGLTVGDSGLFSRDEPLAGLGFAPAVAAEAFALEQGKVSGLLRTNQGFAFITVAEIKPPYLPKIDEVKERVREDVIRVGAVEVAKAKAATMAEAAKKGNFAAAAKAAGIVVRETDLITRAAPLPEIGVSGAVDDVVFALKAGESSGPIPTESAVVVARVAERQDVNAAGLAAERTALTNQLLQQRRQEFFGAYMNKAKKDMRIKVNEAAMRIVTGGG